MKKTLLFLALYNLPLQIALAVFCPNNFNNVNLGDSIQTVLQMCGAPNMQSNKIQPIYDTEEWVYFVNAGFNQGTNELRIVLNHDRVLNITVTANEKVCVPPQGTGYSTSQNNLPCTWTTTQTTKSVANTNVCGRYLSLGDTSDAVRNACGQPVAQNHPREASAQKQEVEFIYKGVPPAADTKFIFENGVLADKVQGSF